MIFVVSGEGPSDIGQCNNSQGMCSACDFIAGPMTHLIDKLAHPITGFSLLAINAVEFVSEGMLNRKTRALPSFFPGKKHGYETAFFFKNARALAKISKERPSGEACPVIAVLFRDADGTHSTASTDFNDKWKSMEDGFKAEGFDNGVPMIPKPKSEAWLLCALASQPYQNCAQLENTLPGNDRSVHAAKKQLDERLETLGKTQNDLIEMIERGTIDPARIDMPSFDRFRERLSEVIKRCIR